MWNGTNSLVFLFRDFFEITFLSKDIPREHFGIYCIGFLIWLREKQKGDGISIAFLLVGLTGYSSI